MRGSENSILQVYLNEIGRYPVLSHDEQRRLAERASAGDVSARHALVRANLRFVVSVARRYQHNGLPLMDLISEGNLGLLRAVECYDADRGYHFISYAAWWVRQGILKAISDKSRLIRLPWNRANELLNIERERCELQAERSGAAHLGALAERLEVEESHLHNLLNCARRPLSLDCPARDGVDALPLRELIPDREDPGPRRIGHRGVSQGERTRAAGGAEREGGRDPPASLRPGRTQVPVSPGAGTDVQPVQGAGPADRETGSGQASHFLAPAPPGGLHRLKSSAPRRLAAGRPPALELSEQPKKVDKALGRGYVFCVEDISKR